MLEMMFEVSLEIILTVSINVISSVVIKSVSIESILFKSYLYNFEYPYLMF